MNGAGRRFFKILTALIASAIVAVSCLSCSLIDGLKDPALAGIKSTPEIVRLLTVAINDRTQISDSYSAIPERQRGDVSFSYFTQYLEILRTLIRQGGSDKPTSFRILSPEETEAAIGSSDDYGCAMLLFESERTVPVYIVFETDENGNCVLSFSWISGIINIYNYAQHYFSMLDNRNIEGVYAVLRPGFTGEVYTDDVVYSKAAALSDYYMVKVRSLMSQYLITSMTPEAMDILIPRVLDDNNENMVTHNVRLESSGDAYIISDSINQEPDMQLSYITDSNGARLLRCGATYNYRSVVNAMGNPMNVSFNSEVIRVEEARDGSVWEIHKIIVNYRHLLLVFEGHGDGRRSWEGTLMTVVLTEGSEYYLSSGVTAGISQSDLLVIYPYLDKLNYTMTFRNSFGNVQSVVFEIADDRTVTGIRVTNIE